MDEKKSLLEELLDDFVSELPDISLKSIGSEKKIKVAQPVLGKYIILKTHAFVRVLGF